MVEEHSRGFGELREMVIHLDQKVDRFRDELDQRLNGRVGTLDQKLSTHFTWLVGIQAAVLLAVVGALIAK
jgi:hypothetical protein